jgi:hypothetical protein
MVICFEPSSSQQQQNVQSIGRHSVARTRSSQAYGYVSCVGAVRVGVSRVHYDALIMRRARHLLATAPQ